MRRNPARSQADARLREERIAANGGSEHYTKIEIGDRDGWMCGICQDTSRLVDPTQHHRHPLAPVVDHVVPVRRGGADTYGNVQIAHRRCNATKHDQLHIAPEYAAAVLTRSLDGTPVPLDAWFAQAPLSDEPRKRMRQIFFAHQWIEDGKLGGPLPLGLQDELAALLAQTRSNPRTDP